MVFLRILIAGRWIARSFAISSIQPEMNYFMVALALIIFARVQAHPQMHQYAMQELLIAGYLPMHRFALQLPMYRAQQHLTVLSSLPKTHVATRVVIQKFMYATAPEAKAIHGSRYA